MNKFIIVVILFFSTPFSSAEVLENANTYFSLNFQDIPIRVALQLMAHMGKKNIVINDAVKGNITLHINHIKWNDALHIVLQTQGLDLRIVNNVIFIGPANEMLSWDETSKKQKEAAQLLIPLTVESVILHYSNASDLAKTIKDEDNSFLSSRGHISIDKRTNSLLINDIPEKIQLIKEVIESLDTPVRQVLIEARIVTVNRDFEKDLGIQFGISQPNHLSGTLTGANELAGGTSPSAVPITDRLNVDFSASSSSSGATPASIGLALAKLGNGILLDLELSALESQGEAKIISSPRLMTANQQSAFIESGEEIPYQESTSSGATAVIFKKAVLSLKVTPQISANNKIMLDLAINQDMPNGILVNGVPEVTTKEIQTHVLVNNNQTLVLGGIYRQEKSHMIERVPFLSNLPGIGSIFQKKTDKIAYEELLIFITPKIINEEM